MNPTDLGIDIVDVMALLGIIAAIAAGIKAIIYLVTPVRTIHDKIEEHDKILNEYERYFEHDKQAIEDLTDLTRDSLKIQLSILNHMIDGNGISTMKKLRNELQEKL